MRWLFRTVIWVCPVIKSRKTGLMTEASKEIVLLCMCLMYVCMSIVNFSHGVALFLG